MLFFSNLESVDLLTNYPNESESQRGQLSVH